MYYHEESNLNTDQITVARNSFACTDADFISRQVRIQITCKLTLCILVSDHSLLPAHWSFFGPIESADHFSPKPQVWL